MRGHLIPKFLHGFVLGKISDDRLRMLDIQIRGAVREWLRLPKDVPTGYFHAAVKDGGLGLPSLRAAIPDLILRRFGALATSEWPVANAAAKSVRIRNKLRWAGKQVLKFSKENPRTHFQSVRHFWGDSLHTSVDGFELRESRNTLESTRWLRERSEQCSGRDFVQFVHTHINTLPSRVRASRGRRNNREEGIRCRAGCMATETTTHIIQQCFRTHGGRIKRHDCVVGVVAKAMTDLGWTVEMEPKLDLTRASKTRHHR